MFNDLLFIPFEYGKMDCWILAREVFSRLGVNVPDYSPAVTAVMKVGYELGFRAEKMKEELINWDPLAEPEVPCLVFSEGHVGVYIGKGKFIHTSKKLVYPAIERLDNPKHATKKFYRFNQNNSS